MEKVRKSGLTMRATRVTTRKAESTAKVNSCGPMAQLTREASSTTTFKVKECILGQMAVNTLVNGAITRCTAQVCSHGTMVDTMRASTSTIRRKVEAFLPGPTVVSMMASGRTANSTVRVSTTPARARSRKDSGLKASVSSGSRKKHEA